MNSDVLVEGFSTYQVAVDGYQVMAYLKKADPSVANGHTVFCLNGGPGLPCDYLRDSHAVLCESGFDVVSYDQLGTGRSDKPEDPALWTIERYAEEVEAVRTALNLDKVHLLGHSWGGWLAIEYAVKFQQNLHSLVLQGTAADIPLLTSEMERLKSALGPETLAMMHRYEAEGNFRHPEYRAAITLLDHRHVCRLPSIPDCYQRSRDGQNRAIYEHMQGPNEFHYIGNLRAWSRAAELANVTVPALITAGVHDEITPVCARNIAESLGGETQVRIFPNSSHHPHFEEPTEFFPVLKEFLTSLVPAPETELEAV